MAADLLRSWVLSTREWPLLGQAYRALYRRVEQSLNAESRSLPHGARLFIRRGPSTRTVPGLSDLDLGVLHPPLSVQQRTELLEQFWRNYYRLKRRFPLLGEVDVLSHQEHDDYRRLGGGQLDDGKRYVDVRNGETFSEPPSFCILQRQRFILAKYQYEFLPKLYRWFAVRDVVSREVLGHCRRKLMALLALPPAEARWRDGVSEWEEILNALPRLPVALRPDTELGPLLRRSAPAAMPPLDGAEIVNGYPGDDTDLPAALVLLPEDLPAPRRRRILESILHHSRSYRPAADLLAPMFPAPRPIVLPRLTIPAWRAAFPFVASAMDERWEKNERGQVKQSVAAQYCGWISLKNNWRTAPNGRLRLALYDRLAARIDAIVGSLGLATEKDRPAASVAEGLEKIDRRLAGVRRWLTLGAFVLVAPAAFAVDPKPLVCGTAQLAAMGVPMDETRIDSQLAPEFAPVRPFLAGIAKNWYSISIPIPKEGIDPLFVEVAKVTGGTAFFGGGSDLIDLALVQSPKLASPGEINVIRPHDMYEAASSEKQWSIHEVAIPAFKERTARQSISINGESGQDLLLMVDNANQGRYLVAGNSFINVPFKHGHIATVNSQGEGRLYFRTPRDFDNWHKKILTLPDEDTAPANVYEGRERSTQVTVARMNTQYALIVYMRTKSRGWRFSPKSEEIVKGWVRNFPEMWPNLKTDLRDIAVRQGVSPETQREVLREFGVR